MRFSKARLDRMHGVLTGYVERGELPGLVTLVSRGGEVHVDAIGDKTAGGSDPMRRDTIFRIASMRAAAKASGAARPPSPRLPEGSSPPWTITSPSARCF